MSVRAPLNWGLRPIFTRISDLTLVQGSGRITLTGKLGDVMQESAQAAVTYVRSRAAELGLAPDFHKNFRSDACSRVRQNYFDRQAGRRNAGICAGGGHVCPFARR